MGAEATVPASPMRALRARQRDCPGELVYEEDPRPTPAADEVRVAVRAAAITFAELTWPETWEANAVNRIPIVDSHEFAGTVERVGAGAHDPAVGDSVIDLVPFERDGSAAEDVVLPAGWVARMGQAVADVDAVAAVLPALAAWEALSDHVHLAPGRRLLVGGAIDGVGAFLTRFAHQAGAHVIVTESSASTELAALLQRGHIKVAIAQTFSLAARKAAYESGSEPRSVGEDQSFSSRSDEQEGDSSVHDSRNLGPTMSRNLMAHWLGPGHLAGAVGDDVSHGLERWLRVDGVNDQSLVLMAGPVPLKVGGCTNGH